MDKIFQLRFKHGKDGDEKISHYGDINSTFSQSLNDIVEIWGEDGYKLTNAQLFDVVDLITVKECDQCNHELDIHHCIVTDEGVLCRNCSHEIPFKVLI